MTAAPKRQSAPSAPALPSSAEACAVRDAAVGQRVAAVAEIDRLAGTRNAVLLSGDDDAAERLDVETARLRRSIERHDLQRPALDRAIVEAEAREEAERQRERVERAEEAIASVLTELDTNYRHPARLIAAFLQRWQAANELAKAAKVKDLDDRLRCKPAVPQPDREEVSFYYIDERGRETDQPYPVGEYYGVTEDGKYLDERRNVIEPYEKRARRTMVPVAPIPAVGLGELFDRVALPALSVADAVFHPPEKPTVVAEPAKVRAFGVMRPPPANNLPVRAPVTGR